MNFYILFLITYILKFFYSLQVGLVPDEAYYWTWSRNLDFSFYDQGPGVALYIRFFTYLFGDTIYSLRLAANIAGLLTSLFIFRIAEILELGKKQKIFLFLFLVFIPAFYAGGFLIMHDSPLLLSWSAALYFTVRYLKERKNSFIYAIFFFLGTGALSKHTMIFYVFSILLWLVFSPGEYRILRNKHLYLGIGLTALMISPVIYWNLQNDWDNVDAIVNLRSAGSVNVKKFNTGDMILGQVLSISPIFYGFMGLLFLKYFYESITNSGSSFFQKLFSFIKNSIYISGEKETIYKFLFFNAIVLPLFFLIMSIYRVIQANWLYASILPISLLFVTLIRETKINSLLFYSSLTVALFMDIYSMFSIPISKMIPLSINPYYILGTRNLGYLEIVNDLENILKNKHPGDEIVANRYQDAAILSWYLPGKPPIQSLNILQKNQYNYWLDMEKGKDYLLVYIQEKTCAKAFIFFQPILHEMFEQVIEYPEKEVVIDGNLVKRYQVWYLRNYEKDWAWDLRTIIQEQIIENGILIGLKNPPDSKSYKLKKTDYNGMEMIHSYMDRAGEVECSFLQKR